MHSAYASLYACTVKLQLVKCIILWVDSLFASFTSINWYENSCATCSFDDTDNMNNKNKI